MRAPSFKGLRPDKTPEECVLEPVAGSKRATGSGEAELPGLQAPGAR